MNRLICCCLDFTVVFIVLVCEHVRFLLIYLLILHQTYFIQQCCLIRLELEAQPIRNRGVAEEAFHPYQTAVALGL